jgi:protein-S-isoprenylcysteine O-methyltransferase Ste14
MHLFRWRSITPLPVLAVLLFLLWSSEDTWTPDGPVDFLLTSLGILLAFAGEALRFWTLSQVPEGTSGQGFELEAQQLNTQGPYAYVRNPLYLGNFLICLGLLLVADNLWSYLIGLSFFWIQYFFIIRAEESFLLRKYGQEFRSYMGRVPRWIPSRSPAYTGKLRGHFDLRRALRKEHNPFNAWASGLVLLLGWKFHLRGALTSKLLAVLILLEIAVLTAFGLLKGLKRGWFGVARARSGEAKGGTTPI